MSVEDKLPKDQYSEEFWELMKNRMMMSYFKYGDLKKAFPNKINALETLLLRLHQYKYTGNTENLVDAANYCMIEFMLPAIPGAKFESTDSDQSPGRVWNHGPINADPNENKFTYKKEGD